MAQLTTRRLYEDGTTPTKEQLDAFVDDIETFVNLTKLNDDNIQDAGIDGSSKLADASVTASEFQNSSVTTDKLADASVTTAKIADDAITTAKIDDGDVTTAKIADDAVTTAKIADENVTLPKFAATNLTKSATTSWNITASSYTDTGLSVSITTTGRPVLVGLTSHPSSSGNSALTLDSTSGGMARMECNLRLMRDSTEVATWVYRWDYSTVRSDATELRIPPSALSHVDFPAAGTYTYKLQAKVNTTTTRIGGINSLNAVEL